MRTAPRAAQQDSVAPHPTLQRYYSDPSGRRPFVKKIFDTTAAEYGWINGVMSLGTGIRYRKDALYRAGVRKGMRVLDACTGNGQVIRAASEMVGETGWIVGLDASLGMLAVGSQAIKSPFAQGYVESLPFSSRSFDFVTMGYALRHVSSLGETFCEYHRVLKPGGRLLVLEFTRPSSSVMYYLSKMYLRYLVPAIARMKSRNSRTLMEYF